jgi:hypothetical protein
MGSHLEKAPRFAMSGEKAISASSISRKKGAEVKKKNSPTNHSSMR